jgi:hypothetical protein
VLLVPYQACGCGHAAGPITAPGQVRSGVAFAASAGFVAEDPAARHGVSWSWGDRSGDQAGEASERNGSGSVSASHVYESPGVYTVTAHIVDQSGASASVSRRLVVADASGSVVGGSGAFMSPPGARRDAPGAGGLAHLSFMMPAASAPGWLDFIAGKLSFRSKDMRLLAEQGTRAQFAGTGTINGRGGYQFAMSVSAGPALGKGEAGRVGLKIWHLDPASKARIVDYDSEGAGRPLMNGRIAVGQ